MVPQYRRTKVPLVNKGSNVFGMFFAHFIAKIPKAYQIRFTFQVPVKRFTATKKVPAKMHHVAVVAPFDKFCHHFLAL